jgi:hypothetical protein
VRTGEAVTLKVTDAATGAPVGGAKVGTATSAADGSVTAGPWAEPGVYDVKAEQAGFVRSNRVRVAVSAPDAPPIALPVIAARDRTPPTPTLLRHTSRRLSGSFAADPSGLKMVKLRLTKRLGKRCWYFSGRMERFCRSKCGKGAYFRIGDQATWSYLLPERLTRGRYVLDAIAIDGAFNRTPLARGTTRVVFKVR